MTVTLSASVNTTSNQSSAVPEQVSAKLAQNNIDQEGQIALQLIQSANMTSSSNAAAISATLGNAINIKV